MTTQTFKGFTISGNFSSGYTIRENGLSYGMEHTVAHAKERIEEILSHRAG